MLGKIGRQNFCATAMEFHHDAQSSGHLVGNDSFLRHDSKRLSLKHASRCSSSSSAQPTIGSITIPGRPWHPEPANKGQRICRRKYLIFQCKANRPKLHQETGFILVSVTNP